MENEEFPVLASSPFLAMPFSSALESLLQGLLFISRNYYWEGELLNAKGEIIIVKMSQWWSVITAEFVSLFTPVSLDLNLRVVEPLTLSHICLLPEDEIFFDAKISFGICMPSSEGAVYSGGTGKGSFFCDLTWGVAQHDHISCHSSFLEEDNAYLPSRKASNARWCPKERLFSSNKWVLHISRVLEFPVSNITKKSIITIIIFV